MQKKTITICGFKRPHYFELLLSSLIKNDLNGWEIFIQLEPSNVTQLFFDVANKLLAGIKFSIEVNEKVYGVRQNPFSLMNKVFCNGSLLNIYLEEDIIVSPDITQIAAWYEQQDLKNIVCLNFILGGCFSTSLVSYIEHPSTFVTTKCFNSLGFIVTKDQWENYFLSNWNRFPGYFSNMHGHQADGWDISIYDYLLSKSELKVLQPLLARANHIGKDDGVYCTEEFHEKTFVNMHMCEDKPMFSHYFTHENITTLPFTIRSHLNLYQEMTACLVTLKQVTKKFKSLEKKIERVKKLSGFNILKKFVKLILPLAVLKIFTKNNSIA